MSEHAHDAAHAEQMALALAEEEAKAPPRAILGSYIWLLVTGLLVLLLAVTAFALLPGSPALQTTGEPLGNTAANGFIEVSLLGQTLIVTAGAGWVQQEGGEDQDRTKGDRPPIELRQTDWPT